MSATNLVQAVVMPDIDEPINELKASKDAWAQTGIAERIEILNDIKDALLGVAEEWAVISAEKKLVPASSPLVGEEWISGPYAMMATCNGLIQTLTNLDGKRFLNNLPKRQLPNGQLSVKVLPNNIWDNLLFSGIEVEVWMNKGINPGNLSDHTAGAYDVPDNQRRGKLALVLGAGNISSIAPLDCFQKLFLENQVVILKLNPVNDYLFELMQTVLAALIRRNALRIIKGDGRVGAYLTAHPDIDEIHITGAGATHDAIVWVPVKRERQIKRPDCQLRPSASHRNLALSARQLLYRAPGQMPICGFRQKI